ncbi:hypothetical protein AAVH_06399 [Aphelenchoides avenae]|nr:hypothetical protein AAVH_06399 [Aphelenchus avenae]
MEPETAAQLVSIIALYHEWRKSKSSWQYGIHPINARRKEAGQFHALVHELKEDDERFRQYTRMSIVRLTARAHCSSVGAKFRNYDADNYRRNVILGPASTPSTASPTAFGHIRTLRDALYGNGAFEDIRRMWRQWVRSFYAYKMRRVSRKPKFYAELSFLNELTTEQLSIVAPM